MHNKGIFVVLAYIGPYDDKGVCEVFTTVLGECDVMGMAEVGKLLRDKRERMGVSQGDMADRMEMSQQIVSNWEKGRRRRVDLAALRRVAHAYEIDLDVLARAAGYALPMASLPLAEGAQTDLARRLPALTLEQQEAVVAYAHFIKEKYYLADGRPRPL